MPLVDQGLVSSVNFLTAILLARALEPTGFGVFALTWLVVLFAATLQNALISAPMMSIGPKQSQDDRSAYFGGLFLQQVLAALLSLAIVWVALAAATDLSPRWDLSGIATPLAVTVGAYHTQDFLRRYFFTIGRGYVAIIIDAISYGGQLAVLAWLFAADAVSVNRALWAIAGTSAVSILVGSIFVQALAWHRATFIGMTVRHWRFSRWFAASAVLQFGSDHLFLIVVAALLGPAAVGALRAAQNLMGVVHILTMGLENIVPMRAAWHFHHHGRRALLKYMKRMALFGESATLAVALVIGVAPEFWLGLVFGETYAGFGNLVRWFAVFYILFVAAFFFRAALRAIERTATIFYATAVSACVAVAGAYPLVVTFGASGAVVGMALAQFAGTALLIISFAIRPLKTQSDG